MPDLGRISTGDFIWNKIYKFKRLYFKPEKRRCQEGQEGVRKVAPSVHLP